MTTDPEQIGRLEKLTGPARTAFLDASARMSTAEAQDYLISRHQIVISQPGLARWLETARQAEEGARFVGFLDELRRNARTAALIVDTIADRVVLQAAAERLLLCRLIEALQTGDKTAAHQLGETLAAVIPPDSTKRNGESQGTGTIGGPGAADQNHALADGPGSVPGGGGPDAL